MRGACNHPAPVNVPDRREEKVAGAGTAIRLGLIGCGRLTERGYLPVIAGRAGVVVAAAADPDPARRSEIGGRLPGVRLYGSAEDLCADGGVDGVVVASPPSTHLAAAEHASRAGLPALVEKPPADDVDGARALAALDPVPAIGFNRRFGLGAGLAEAASGCRARHPEGGPLELELAISYRRRSWDPVGALGDALADLGPHLADLALIAAGAGAGLDVAAATSEAKRFELELEAGGLRARLRGRTDRPYRELAVLREPGGEVRFERRHGGLAALFRRRGPHPLRASLGAQLDAWLATLGAGRASATEGGPLADASAGVRVMELLERAAEGSA